MKLVVSLLTKGAFMKKYNNANSILGKINLPLPLSSEEEARLLNSLSTNPEARNILIERNLRLVIYIAKNLKILEYLLAI